MSSPVASSRSVDRRRRDPAVERPHRVVGLYSACNEQRARVEKPCGAQRLEGVEEGDPAPQRHQHRGCRRRARGGSSTSAARSRRRRPRPPAGRCCCRHTVTSSRDGVPQPGDGRRPRRPGSPGDDQLAQRDVEERRPVDGGTGPAQPLHLRARAGRCRRTGSSPTGTDRPGIESARAADRVHRGLHPPQRLDQRRDVLRLHRRAGAQVGREPVADGDQPALAPEPGRRRGGLRGHVDLGQRQRAAPRACTRPGPGGGTR